MKDISQVTCCVIDHGLFLPLARRLAKDYKRVLYHTPWEKGFPSLNDCVPGDGLQDVERCDDIWKVKKDVDLWVFPDIHHGGLQVELESQGFPVWGSRYGSDLEIYRQYFLRTLKAVGLEVPPFITVAGLTALREHLMDTEDKYVKISKYRGSMETWHWRNWGEDEGVLDALAVEFGPCKEMVTFLVFDAIPTDLEIGGDTYSINGKFPHTMLHGLEWKDKGYLGDVCPVGEMPEQILAVNAAMATVLGEARYCNFWSAEIRVKDEQFYFMDPTCRAPCPGSASQLLVYNNLGEIVWQGAHGELVQPETDAKFTAEVVLTCKGEKGAWHAVGLPAALRDNVFFRGACECEDRTCLPPSEAHGDEVGWLAAKDTKLPALLKQMQALVKQLPDGLTAHTESLFELLKEAQSAEEKGVGFGQDKLPEPETALAK